jgi:hypothetical protein
MAKPSRKHQRRPRPASHDWSSTGGAPAGPLAVPLREAARQLGITEQLAEELATRVEPYAAFDGTSRWSLLELRRVLTGRVVTR